MKIDNKIWFVLYTKPQQELKAAERLEKIGFESYCPYKEETRQWSDRKKTIKVPLLKSYVFVRLENQERSKVFDIPGVVRYLFWLGKPAEVPDREINDLKESLSMPYLDISVENLMTGQRLLIPSGPFKEQEGRIIKVNKKQITVALIQLGFYVTFEY
ncbi:UpxY family transcription antiterminator [Flavobacterium sp. ACAM 123]|uniref:UpxY family transcription antiterminator n=1 Tax=Flavobacterium sp. ACAM 123 TaxID=1189620 RepID=UPI000313740A|nr:UpxY family transcription antiterminator [Flavobacterium sp. ACAM 123]